MEAILVYIFQFVLYNFNLLPAFFIVVRHMPQLPYTFIVAVLALLICAAEKVDDNKPGTANKILAFIIDDLQ